MVQAEHVKDREVAQMRAGGLKTTSCVTGAACVVT